MAEIDRRSVLEWGAWSAPVVAAAVAAPSAAASTADAIALLLSPESATTYRDVRSSVNLSIMNTSSTEFTGTVSVVFSGAFVRHSDSYLGIAIAESPEWSGQTRTVYSTTTVSWSGTLAPGGIGSPLLLQPLSQHTSYPTTSTIGFTTTDESAAPKTFTVTWY